MRQFTRSGKPRHGATALSMTILGILLLGPMVPAAEATPETTLGLKRARLERILQAEPLSVDESETPDDVEIQAIKCAPSGHGQPTPTYVGLFSIHNLLGRVVDVRGFGTADRTPIQLYRFLNGANQKWHVYECYYSGYGPAYIFQGLQSGKCMDGSASQDPQNGLNTFLYSCNGTSQQTWELWALAEAGYYILYNWRNSRCLDAAANADSIWLYTWTCHGRWNQAWALEPR